VAAAARLTDSRETAALLERWCRQLDGRFTALRLLH